MIYRSCFILITILSAQNDLFALPFSITPGSNTNFPTSINVGQVVTATYTITNNTTKVLTGLYFRNLPNTTNYTARGHKLRFS